MVYVPYICGTLRAYAEQDPWVREHWTFSEPIWRVRDLEAMLDEVGEPDLLGCSVYVWNHRNSHRLARAVKERFPDCLVVFGGPHVPNDPSDYLDRHPWVDVLVHGEGEEAFAGLLRGSWEDVPGLSYRRGGVQHFTKPGGRLSNLDFPGAYSTGYLDGFVESVRAEFPDAVLHASLETNRGCPYSCAFCDWGMATMTKLRQFPAERVEADLEWMARRGIATLILNDANFGILPRDIRFAEKAAELKRTHGFPKSLLPLGFAKNNKDRAFEIVRLLNREGLDAAGCNVNFSLQSMSQDALDAIARQNIPLENYRILAGRYAEEGLRLMPDLIFPLPGETAASFRRGYADLASWPHVDRIMVYPCTILPNAPMARPEYRERWGLVTRTGPMPSQAWLMVEGEAAEEIVETVVSTSTLTFEEAAETRAWVAFVDALEFAGLAREIRRAAGRLKDLRPDEFYSALMDWQVRNHGLLFMAIAQVYLRGMERPEEPMWMSSVFTLEGQELPAPRCLIADALQNEERFFAELRASVLEVLGEGERVEDLLRYQRSRWITPSYDPRQPAGFTGRYDWPAWLAGAPELEERPVTLTWAPRPEWLDSPFLGLPQAWSLHALGLAGVDPACVH